MPQMLTPELARRFEREILVHVDVAHRMAMSLTRDRDRADDLVQDATLRALRAYPELRSRENLRSWFARIVHTTFLDRVRYEKRRPTASIDDEDGPVGEADLGVVEFEPSVFAQGLDDDYDAALGTLPVDWRAAVQLVDVEGLSYEEAARTLDVPVGTVRSRLHRARQKLYTELCRRLRLGWCSESG